MTEGQDSLAEPANQRSTPRPLAAAQLLVLAVACCLLALSHGWWSAGREGFFAAAIATLVGGGAMLLSFRAPSWILGRGIDEVLRQGPAWVLAATLVRMGIALSFCLWVTMRRGWLYDAGAVWYLLFIYLGTLPWETRWAVNRCQEVLRSPSNNGLA